MAISDNFVFADPALNNAAIARIQAQAAVEAARQQQFGETLRALRAERQAASDREERRAIREADIRRLDATEAERRRQFDINTGLTREDIASREKIASGGTARREEDELYNNILNLIERADDVPTASELEAQIIGLSAPRQKALRDRRTIRFNSLLRDFGILTDEAATLNALIGTKDPKTGLTLSASDALNRSIRKQHLRVNPAGVIEPLMRRPREDPVAGAAPLPGSAPRAEHVTDVLGRIAQRVAGNTAAGMIQIPERAGILDSMGRMGRSFAGAAGGLVNRFFVPPQETNYPGLPLMSDLSERPVFSPALPLPETGARYAPLPMPGAGVRYDALPMMSQFSDRPISYDALPMMSQFSDRPISYDALPMMSRFSDRPIYEPPLERRLGADGRLYPLDYSGAEYDYGAPNLAPPVFVPPY